MGSFDSVFARCPRCDSLIEFQSKAGCCDLKRYKLSSVPVAIAADISGRQEECASCKARVSLIVPTGIARVAMTIVEIGDGEESWD